MLAIKQGTENNTIDQPSDQKGSGFFMTETEDFHNDMNSQ